MSDIHPKCGLGTMRAVREGKMYPYVGRTDAYVETRGPQDHVVYYDNKRALSFRNKRAALRHLADKVRAERLAVRIEDRAGGVY